MESVTIHEDSDVDEILPILEFSDREIGDALQWENSDIKCLSKEDYKHLKPLNHQLDVDSWAGNDCIKREKIIKANIDLIKLYTTKEEKLI